jgi:hypothetical protein
MHDPAARRAGSLRPYRQDGQEAAQVSRRRRSAVSPVAMANFLILDGDRGPIRH